ncbi:MAG: DUF1285 domain-containing protein [Syntrophomonadaceae bacterium]
MDLTEIIIKKDGKWYFGAAEMFRRNILNILAQHIEKGVDGSFGIRLGEDFNPLTVEDVPFFATGYSEEDGRIKLTFHDLQEMFLEGEIMLILKGDVPYISFRWEADTRLSRGVYWKLSQYFQFRDEQVYIVPPVWQEQ